MNELKTVKLSRCRCGGHPVMNERISYAGCIMYMVYCNHCGRTTSEYDTMKYATEMWEEMQRRERTQYETESRH